MRADLSEAYSYLVSIFNDLGNVIESGAIDDVWYLGIEEVLDGISFDLDELSGGRPPSNAKIDPKQLATIRIETAALIRCRRIVSAIRYAAAALDDTIQPNAVEGLPASEFFELLREFGH